MRVNITKSSAIRIGGRWDVGLAPLTVDGRDIPWAKELKYLGMTILAAKSFSICLHSAKTRFFQSLNAILGKIGDSEAITLILSIAASNCIPILTYGLDACHISKAQLKSFEYTFQSVFCKIFKTFDKNVITQCQYYTGYLPGRLALDLIKLRFLNKLKTDTDSPPGFMMQVAGGEECCALEAKYSVNLPVSNTLLKYKVWNYLQQELHLS